MISLPEIQYITRDHPGISHAEQARLMYSLGIEWVQIRMKGKTKDEILREAELALGYAQKSNCVLIINDSTEIAKELKTHGVHLGLNDIPVNEARNELGDGFIIGGTANSIDDVQLQAGRGADYIGLGPFRFTHTKKNLSPVLGLTGYQEIMKEIQKLNIEIPVVAVGGITYPDIIPILQQGIQSVAMSAALLEWASNF